MKVGVKIIGGFCIISVLLAIVGITGMTGLKKTGKAADIIMDEKVPIADASMEGMIALISGRDLMGEFLLTRDAAELDEAEKEFQQTVVDFDTEVGYLKKNGTDEIKKLTEEADGYHEKFQENALQLMADHRELIVAEARADEYMADFDEHVDEIKTLLAGYEEELTRVVKIDEKVDAAMEAKTILIEQQAIAEEYMGLRSLDGTKGLRKAFAAKMGEFDAFENLLLEKIALEHEDFVELCIGKGKMFDQKDNALHKVVETREYMELVDEFSEKGDLTMDKVEETAAREMASAMQSADSAQTNGNRVIIVITIAGFLIALGLGFFIGRSITLPLGGEPGEMAAVAQQIAFGDLSMQFDASKKARGLYAAMQEMTGALKERAQLFDTIATGDLTRNVTLGSEKDQLGKALQMMSEKLNAVLGEISAATEQINSGAGQVSDTSQALSQGATEQAASLEEITSSMTEMASQTKTNAENAGQANQLATDAKGAAETGNSQMQEMVTAMGEINEAGQNISKIIKVIDEIAFQTNLLALNAAVEAARAGRHGKGFAVVAEEVRNLAARSAKAAKETAELIEGSVAKTGNGTTIANQTAESLAEIVNSVTKVTDLVGEIAAASNEQAEGIAQVNQGLGQIDQVTQQNTASAEEGASAAEELSSQATHLQQLVSHFKVKGMVGAGLQRQALPPASDHQSKPQPQEGWDSMQGALEGSDPSEVISLDDEEFGKY